MNITVKHLLATAFLGAFISILAVQAGVPFNSFQGTGGLGYNPIAYVAGNYAANPTNKFEELVSRPQVGVWYISFFEEDINWTTASASFSIAKRLELSYGYGAIGNAPGKDIISTHNLGAKYNIIPENSLETKWIPAISVGGIYKRTSADLLTTGAGLRKDGGDFYAVASKLITQTPLPVLLSAGLLVTDEYVYGIQGHGQYDATGIGSVSVLPLKNLAVGVEYKQGADVGNSAVGKLGNADYWNLHLAWLATDSLAFVAAYGYAGDRSNGLDEKGLGQALALSVQYGF